jgi:nucleotide-binding universal stress UspA family protein
VTPKKILAALDGSAPAEAALRHALDLARPLGARIEGVFVKDTVVLDAYMLGDLPGYLGATPIADLLGGVESLFEARGKAVLAAAGKTCEGAGAAFSGRVEDGRVGSVIQKQGRTAELVAMGIWGAGAAGRSVGGHLTSLLGSSPKPVLAAPAVYEKASKFVCAYDDSPSSKRALKLAVRLARAAGRLLEVWHVSDDPSAGRVLERAAKAASGAPKLKLKRLGGEPRPVLRRLTTEGSGFMLVMGTHGHGYLHELVLGSTTHHVLHGANVPVLFSK